MAKSKPKAKKAKKTKAKAEASILPAAEVKDILKEYGIQAGILKSLPAAVAQEIAKALREKRELDRETGIILDELTRLGKVVTRRRDDEEQAKRDHAEAKKDLEKALEQEHEAVLRLGSVSADGFQRSLPMGYKADTPKDGPGYSDAQLAGLRAACLSLPKDESGLMTAVAASEIMFGRAKSEDQALAVAALDALVQEKVLKRIAGKDGKPAWIRSESPQSAAGGSKSKRSGKGSKAQQAAQAAQDTPPAEELLESTREILARLRGGKKLTGIGPTKLALQLFGNRSAELKARALTILEALEAEKAVARVEGANKEPSFYPLDPKAAKSAEEF